MKQLVEFIVKENQSIWVEIDIPALPHGDVEVSRTGEVVKRATKSFQDALSPLITITEAVIEKLDNLANRPQELDVEFGLKMSAEADIIIVSSDVEATFKVVLKWKGG